MKLRLQRAPQTVTEESSAPNTRAPVDIALEPYPYVPNQFFLHKFSGAGRVIDSVSDSGHTIIDAIVDQVFSDPDSSLMVGGKLYSRGPNWWFGALATDAVPPSADYYVEGDFYFANPTSADGNLIMAGRWDEAGFGTGYYVKAFRNSSGDLQGFLRRRNGGGANDDDWGFPPGIGVGDAFTIKLDMQGPIITVSVDGTPQITRDETGVSLTTQVGRVAWHVDVSSGASEDDVAFDRIRAYG